MKTLPTLLAMAALSLCLPGRATTSLTEGFNHVDGLSGWLLVNQSDPVGNAWFQGNAGVFSAQSGAADAYIGVNYLSANNGFGIIDNWLITPELTFNGVTELSFYTRSAGTPGFADRLDVLFGAGSAPGAFSQSLLTLGVSGPYGNSWQRYTALIDATGTGRFAFHYSGTDDSADYIGIDTVSVHAVPEPASYLMLGAGLALVAWLRRRRRAGPRGALARLAAFGSLGLGLVSGAGATPAGQQGMVVVRDQATGQLRAPTPAEFQHLQAHAPDSGPAVRTAAAAQVTLKADGTRVSHVGRHTLMYSILTRDADGQTHLACVSGADAASAALQAPSSSTTPTQEKHHAD